MVKKNLKIGQHLPKLEELSRGSFFYETPCIYLTNPEPIFTITS